MDKFLRCILNLIIGLVVDKNELQLLKMAFEELDTDRSGSITE